MLIIICAYKCPKLEVDKYGRRGQSIKSNKYGKCKNITEVQTWGDFRSYVSTNRDLIQIYSFETMIFNMGFVFLKSDQRQLILFCC